MTWLEVEETNPHWWIRTVALDGRWCEACGLSEANWVGGACPGHGAARYIERMLIQERAKHAVLLQRLDELANVWESKEYEMYVTAGNRLHEILKEFGNG